MAWSNSVSSGPFVLEKLNNLLLNTTHLADPIVYAPTEFKIQGYNICKVEADGDELGGDITNGFRRSREEGITMGYYQKKKVEITYVFDHIEGELDDGESEDGLGSNFEDAT
ncbi:hypothetical protein L2E82_05639 [Cichorium intybus]|uniref:Uncharacterized protein n=1 Tax=Cichorium intybus TaxID=13427 RepID=A0ACB9H8Y4_CICIN|nr:hypothetical protein L2E82_05639 [Cichorium intybus]